MPTAPFVPGEGSEITPSVTLVSAGLTYEPPPPLVLPSGLS